MTVSKGRPIGRPRTEAEKAADIKRTGRPATIIANESVTQGVTIRLTPTEHKQIIADAKKMNMSLSVYLRHCWQTTREGRK